MGSETFLNAQKIFAAHECYNLYSNMTNIDR